MVALMRNFYWFNKNEFRDFLLFNLPFLCFETSSGQFGHIPHSIDHHLKKNFGTPEIALDILTAYQALVNARVNDDYEYSKIIDFFKKHLIHGNSLQWIGKFTDLLSEDSDFANEQRVMFNGNSDQVQVKELFAFCTFLNDINYLHKIKEEYEIGLEYRGEIESMKSEPDYYFPTAEESLERLQVFIIDKQSKKNIVSIANSLFPRMSFKLTDDSL